MTLQEHIDRRIELNAMDEVAQGLQVLTPLQQQAEIWAEDAWLRAAEAGTPDTWAEENIARLTEIYGYGPPPGYGF